MNATIDAVEPVTFRTAMATTRAPTSITTTLYELLAVLQTVAEPDEDELIVALVASWIHTGRLTFRCGSARTRDAVAKHDF